MPDPHSTPQPALGFAPGESFPDLELPDHNGYVRQLSELVAGDPTVLHTYRGWWCPKEQRYFRRPRAPARPRMQQPGLRRPLARPLPVAVK
jgi:hypothetical protein